MVYYLVYQFWKKEVKKERCQFQPIHQEHRIISVDSWVPTQNKMTNWIWTFFRYPHEPFLEFEPLKGTAATFQALEIIPRIWSHIKPEIALCVGFHSNVSTFPAPIPQSGWQMRENNDRHRLKKIVVGVVPKPWKDLLTRADRVKY